MLLTFVFCNSDLGHSRSGEVPVFRCSILPWSWLLRPGVWCDSTKHLQDFRQLERRVLDPGKSQRPWEFPLRGAGQQDWLGEQTGKFRWSHQGLSPFWFLSKYIVVLCVFMSVLLCVSGNNQTSTGLVSEQKQHPLFWNECQGGNQCGAGLPDYCTQRP